MTGRPPLLQLPPLQIPPPPGPNLQHVFYPPNLPGPGPPRHNQQLQGQPPSPLNTEEALMDQSNFKVLVDMRGRSACVTLLQPHGPWMQLPNRFVESLLHATERVLVHDLILKHHQLRSLPENFDRLSSLSVLDLSFNRLEAVPDVLCQLRQLQQLCLQHNKITAIPQCLGEQLGNLKILYLQHNNLFELPEGVCSASLETLDVNDNKICSFSEEVGKMTSLKQLHASCNTLNFLPVSLYKLDKLEELYLSNNHIQHISSEIHSMTSLKQLHLANNKLQFLPVCIAAMHQLQGLTLTGNNMRFPPLSACRAGIQHLQQYMMDKVESSIVDFGCGNVIITNLYYAGSDSETGNESPFEDID